MQRSAQKSKPAAQIIGHLPVPDQRALCLLSLHEALTCSFFHQVNVKIFLAAYMIAARPNNVFESIDDLEKRVLNASEPLLICFHRVSTENLLLSCRLAYFCVLILILSSRQQKPSNQDKSGSTSRRVWPRTFLPCFARTCARSR
jgi:hypothetical protein